MSKDTKAEVTKEVEAAVEPVLAEQPVGVAKLSIQERAKQAQIEQDHRVAAARREKAMQNRAVREQAERESITRMRHSKLGAERVVGTNPIALPWPQDQDGAFTKLRSGGTEAAQRVNGDRVKLVKLLETLKIIGDHAKARFAMDVEARGKARENHVSALARNEIARRKSAEAKAAEYIKAAERTLKNAGITKVEE